MKASDPSRLPVPFSPSQVGGESRRHVTLQNRHHRWTAAMAAQARAERQAAAWLDRAGHGWLTGRGVPAAEASALLKRWKRRLAAATLGRAIRLAEQAAPDDPIRQADVLTGVLDSLPADGPASARWRWEVGPVLALVVALAGKLIDAAREAGAPGVIALLIAVGAIGAAAVWSLPRIVDSLARLRSGVSAREQELEQRVVELEATVHAMHDQLEEQARLFDMLADHLPDSFDVQSLKRAFAVSPCAPAPGSVAHTA